MTGARGLPAVTAFEKGSLCVHWPGSDEQGRHVGIASGSTGTTTEISGAACLDAAMSLLEEGTEATLSLCAVARRAGVSANAPYRHYRDKDDGSRGWPRVATRTCESSCPTPTRSGPAGEELVAVG